MMNGVKAVGFVFLVACGGTVSSGDDAAVTPDVATEATTDAAADASSLDGDAAAPIGASCVTEAGAKSCDAGTWAWGDAGALCSDVPCPLGSVCYTLGAGSSVGVCE